MKFLVFAVSITLCAAPPNMVLRDGEPCQFWPGSFYFDNFCYKVVHSSIWQDGRLACPGDHHQANMAELTSMRSVHFISMYSRFMEDVDPDPLYWLGGSYEGSGQPHWMDLDDTSLLPTKLNGANDEDFCLVMDTADKSLQWHICTDQGISSLCQIEVPLTLCPWPDSTYHSGSCYIINTGPKNQAEAQTACNSIKDQTKAYLVEINSLQEFRFVSLSAQAYMDENSLMTTAFYTGGVRENGMLRWLTSGEEITPIPLDWWSDLDTGVIVEDCLALSLRANDVPMLENVDCNVMSAYVCEMDIYEERYVVSFPLLRMFSDGLPEVTLTVSAIRKGRENAAMLVEYRSNSSHLSTMMTFNIGGGHVFNRTLSDVEDFMSESGVGTAAMVITSDRTFVVSYSYAFPDRSQDLFTGSILYPLGPYSSHYFVVTSTAACEALPVTEISATSNPILSNSDCRCESFLLVVAVEAIDLINNVSFKFPMDTKFTFKHSGIELEDPSYMRIPLQLYETAFIITESDLSGTFIEASHNVLVYAGYTVKNSSLAAKCSTSVQMMQAKPVSEGQSLHYTAPYELPPPDGFTSLENYRVVALEENTVVTLTPSQGRELEQISFARVGEIREFSLPNTDLYVIESSSPVLVYRLSFAAPNQSTGINDVITPCLDSVFSKTSLRNSAGYLFSRDDLDYKHLVIREYTGDGIPSDLQINDETYDKPSYHPTVFTAPGATMLRLDVSGLDHITVTRANSSSAIAAALVCAGKTGASGFCTDLEPRHSTTIRSTSTVNLTALATRDFHKFLDPVVKYGFNASLLAVVPPLQDTSPAVTEDEGRVSQPNEEEPTTSNPEITSESTNDTVTDCRPRVVTIVNIMERAKEFNQEIKQSLYVDVRRTSTFVRTKTSAEDDRPTSQTMGIAAVGFLCFTGLLIILPDAITVVGWLAKKLKE